ncbi:homeobox protein ATH1 [Quercus robur]|uniref:homeobox protein ATH1 n=1 Tax=Quercus robur TaxID=38942 RepID=UPI00216210E6|nr:homeobox protein ATH1 [Quercus robur]XP_050264284.1 homeobox protein ATH1 [Quercus robur]XP_050264286.1 homeobox protein ATH1 [Quercus robur]XP_050264294.1 homeobox protein ATH1 [Quercus robur]XP_050264300.1 homeobox protein ATH1 [Quercus robur]
MMDNDLFRVPIDMSGQSAVYIGGFQQHTTPNSLVQSDSFDLNRENHIMSGFPVLSELQGETINGLHPTLRTTNGVGIVDSNELVSLLGRNVVRDSSLSSSRLTSNTEFQEQLAGGNSISAASLATFLSARTGLQDNLNSLAISTPAICPLEFLGTYASNGCSNGLNSSFTTSVNCGYDEVLGNTNTKYSAALELGGKFPVRAELQPYSSTGNPGANGCLSSSSGNLTANRPYSSANFNNELSLTLATSERTVLSGINIPDRCSEMGFSGVTRHCLNEKRLSSEQTSCNSKELSVSFGSYKPTQFSQVILGSRYLRVIQEILVQIANYSLENLDHMSYSNGRNGASSNMPFSSNCSAERWMSSMVPDVDGGFEPEMESTLRRRAIEAKKTQLLSLLQVVDERYNQCMDEVHTVISAFHAATELDPQIHARFAIQTISFLYKNLRERISNHILAMGAHFSSPCTKEKERSFETSFIQKQWALQQLKSKDHQLWRPQRGLPERSVSVLRAWMFQNFLHPYPKDAEKHLLAVKSGLTRSQVSNWFINARVRLWKPMIEEMYAEMNRRKAHRDDEASQSDQRSHISINNPRLNVT